jgi:hypothetical protein
LVALALGGVALLLVGGGSSSSHLAVAGAGSTAEAAASATTGTEKRLVSAWAGSFDHVNQYFVTVEEAVQRYHADRDQRAFAAVTAAAQNELITEMQGSQVDYDAVKAQYNAEKATALRNHPSSTQQDLYRQADKINAIDETLTGGALTQYFARLDTSNANFELVVESYTEAASIFANNVAGDNAQLTRRIAAFEKDGR